MFVKFFNTFLLIFSFSHLSFAQENIIAKAGSIEITIEEFKNRFELVPQPDLKNKTDIEIRKRHFLYSLLAEKLWTLKAERLGFDDSDLMKEFYHPLEKMYARDALYNLEIKNKVVVSKDEIDEGLKRIFIKLHLKTAQAKEKKEIEKLYNLVQNFIYFDSLSNEIKNQFKPVEVEYGQLLKNAEDIVYTLDEGEFSKPVEAPAGWLLFYLDKKENIVSGSPQTALTKVEEIIKGRKEDSTYNDFVNNFFSDKRVTADKVLFQTIAAKIKDILYEKRRNENIPAGERVTLTLSDFSEIKNMIGNDTLKMKFIDLDENSLSAEEFINYLSMEGFGSSFIEDEKIYSELNAKVRTIIEYELLSQEGLKRGLQNLPENKIFLKMWRENYLANVLQNLVADSIIINFNEKDIDFNKEYKSEEYTLEEILTDSLEIIEKVLKELKAGKNFDELVSLFSKNKEKKIINSSEGSQLERIISQMNPGEIYGPIKTSDGYSLFKLVEIKEIENDSLAINAELKEEIKRRELNYQVKKKLIDYTIELAEEFDIKIDENLLENLEVEDWNVFTYKLLGFGGRIPAFPVTTPFYEWYEEWEKRKEQIP